MPWPCGALWGHFLAMLSVYPHLLVDPRNQSGEWRSRTGGGWVWVMWAADSLFLFPYSTWVGIREALLAILLSSFPLPPCLLFSSLFLSLFLPSLPFPIFLSSSLPHHPFFSPYLSFFRISLSNSDWLGTCYVALSGFELLTLLLCLLSAEVTGTLHHAWFCGFFLKDRLTVEWMWSQTCGTIFHSTRKRCRKQVLRMGAFLGDTGFIMLKTIPFLVYFPFSLPHCLQCLCVKGWSDMHVLFFLYHTCFLESRM